MRRILAVAVSLFVSAVLVTTPARAVTATYGCDASTVTSNLSVAHGQTLTFTIETTRNAPDVDGCRQMFFYSESVIGYSMVDDLGNPFTIQYGTPLALTNGRTYTLTVTAPTSGSQNLLAFTINNATLPLYGQVVRLALPGSPDGSAGPPNVLQQVGAPASRTCDEVNDADARFLGYAGGWSLSWARWINDGAGGHVCTRTLVYNNSTGIWDAA